jgi:hypothetical protein
MIKNERWAIHWLAKLMTDFGVQRLVYASFMMGIDVAMLLCPATLSKTMFMIIPTIPGAVVK